jgi:hypothetical protein
VFMALSADSRPHFTTIAAFVSSLEHEIASLFGDVLLYASELGLTVEPVFDNLQNKGMRRFTLRGQKKVSA